MNLDRRRLLELAGVTATASVASLAGCTSGSDGDNGGDNGEGSAENGSESDGDEGENDSEPADETESTDDEYVVRRGDPVSKPWLSTGGAQFASLTATALADRPVLEDAVAATELENDDPLLRLPLVGVIEPVSTLQSVRFDDASLGRVVADSRDGDGGDFARESLETSLDTLVLVDDVYVFVGDVDADEIATALTEPGDRSETAFERTDGIGPFDVYRPVESDSGPDQTFAVGPDAIVFSSVDETADADADSSARVTRAVETRVGARERAIDRIDDLEWVIETGGTGQIVFGTYGEASDDSDAEPSDDAGSDFAGSLTFEGETGATGEYAAAFEGSVPTDGRDELGAAFGATADDSSLEIDDDRLTASATWADVDAVLEGGD